MRNILLTIGALCLCGLTANAEATKGVEVVKTNGETLHIANTALKNMTLAGGEVVLTDTANHTVTISRSEIQCIAPVDEVADRYSVRYDGTEVRIVNPYALRGVTTVIEGAYVTTTNTNESDELAFALSGTTDDGAFTYNGTYKCSLALDGTNITSRRGAAVSILCGKRIAVNVTGDNALTDCAEGEQKACLYFKGHPEITGAGTLSLTGNTNHALSAKEYIQLKKSFGTLRILKAVNDGIHAGQYFQMNGGDVTVENVGGDGVQAEVTDDPADEQNGQLIVKGGTLRVNITAQDVAGLKSDSLLTILGGDITIRATGAADKGIKSKTDLLMTDGTLSIVNSGAGATIDKETETAKGLSADGNIALQGGTITIQMSGTGGKGIKADGTYTQGNKETGEGPTLNVSTTGASYGGTSTSTGGRPGGGG
ncbi:MAG: carbohydrate-binding domain-containing protein, partial [Bacteroidaceae bacterium]|nr:carbohydrate-binding domain-containing protein [Bacteroidaceae bacterium]